MQFSSIIVAMFVTVALAAPAAVERQNNVSGIVS